MVQRVEVVTSVERRRRFTDGQKLMIVEEASMSGASEPVWKGTLPGEPPQSPEADGNVRDFDPGFLAGFRFLVVN